MNEYHYDVIKRDPLRGPHPSRLAYPKARFPLFADRHASGVHNIAGAVVLDVFGATRSMRSCSRRCGGQDCALVALGISPATIRRSCKKVHDRERSV
jgi:hypothetical protein